MKKMMKKVKILTMLLIAGVIFGSNIANVNAVAQTIQVGAPENIPGYVAGTYFTTKTTTSGEYLYCLNIHKNTAQYITANLVGERDAGFAYIMENGYPSKSFTGDRLKDYYITQTAVWWYLDDTTGSSNLGNAFKTTGSDRHNLRPHIQNLVAEAKNAKARGYASTSISLSITDKSMSLSKDAKYYVSEAISVSSSNLGNYKVAVNEGPVGTIITNEAGTSKTTFAPSEKFIVKVPVAKVKDTKMTIKVSAMGTGTVNKAYEYAPVDSSMQSFIPSILTPSNQDVAASIDLNISSSKVTIIKLDKATEKALAGAKLVLKDSNGKVVTSWTSTTNAHVIRNLSNGTYTVEEESAPKGYKKSKEIVSFTVDDSTKDVKVKFYNEARTSVVTITKIDKATGNALAGAVLVVKDATGKEVARFTTTEDPYVLVDLENGTYTIEEESAPNGYKKSDEKITFTIDDEHLSHQINFENHPEIIVPNTASAASIIMTLLGIAMIGSALGFVYKNAKKAK